ncbi:MAG: alpha/beta fold hydrolase, partial [Candidatus Binatia bacterium]
MNISGKGEYLTVDSIRTFYIKAGSGYPLLLIHGGSPGACLAVNWGPNIEPLAESGFTVYAFDQAGFGRTDNPTDHSLEYRVAHARSFIDALKLDHFHLVGNS